MIHTALVPANRSEQARFGAVDGAIIGFFVMLIAASLAFLLVQ